MTLTPSEDFIGELKWLRAPWSLRAVCSGHA